MQHLYLHVVQTHHSIYKYVGQYTQSFCTNLHVILLTSSYAPSFQGLYLKIRQKNGQKPTQELISKLNYLKLLWDSRKASLKREFNRFWNWDFIQNFIMTKYTIFVIYHKVILVVFLELKEFFIPKLSNMFEIWVIGLKV